jgi:hypothetical protein
MGKSIEKQKQRHEAVSFVTFKLKRTKEKSKINNSFP